MYQINIILAKTKRDNHIIAIHLLNPNEYELERAKEDAEAKGFKKIVIHNNKTWPYSTPNESHYYEDQLKRLANGSYVKSIKFWDGDGSSTNQMNLNLDLLPVLIKFLQYELKRIKKAT